MSKKQPLVPIKTTVAAKATRAEVDQILAALGKTSARIPEMDNSADVAALWVAVDEIKKNLSAMQYDAGQRLIQLAPVETYNYTPKGGVREERSRPVKETVVEGIGVIAIEKSGDRKWTTPARELAHLVVDLLMQRNEGTFMSAHETVNMVFDTFSISAPKTTALHAMGLGHLDDVPHVEKDFVTSARVKT